jgi:ABC-type lipoprotein release transport system permease subunit
LYVGLGFALFAALMLSNFIATSISYKRQEIGILRAIGSRGWDVFKIFFAESFIISMINFVLSLAATIAVTIILNGVFRTQVGMLITILSFGIRQVALLLGVSLLVALIATFLPVKKIASQKPIDAIRKR